jgi:hypothetical protein
MARLNLKSLPVLTKSFILRLPNNLHTSLIAIHLKSDEPLRPQDIQELLDLGYIDFDVTRGGWRTNSKGREYLKKVKK